MEKREEPTVDTGKGSENFEDSGGFPQCHTSTVALIGDRQTLLQHQTGDDH